MQPTAHPQSLRDRRDYSIDALRGVGIAAVVLSHVVSVATVGPTEEPVRLSATIALYLINVQVLAFVSGLVYRRAALATRARTLLVPLACWLTIGAIAVGRDVSSTVAGSVKGVATGGNAFWFLWALFVGLVLSDLVRERYPALLTSVAVGAGLFWSLIPAWTLVRGAGLLLPFLVLGMVWGDSDRETTERIEASWPLLLLGFVGLTAVGAWYLRMPLWVGYSVPLRLLPIQAAAGLVGVLGCVGLLGAVRRLRGKMLGYAACIGAASMGIYGAHGTLIALFPVMTIGFTILGVLAIWAALMILSFGMTFLIGRSRPLTVLLLGGRAPRYETLGRTVATSVDASFAPAVGDVPSDT